MALELLHDTERQRSVLVSENKRLRAQVAELQRDRSEAGFQSADVGKTISSSSMWTYEVQTLEQWMERWCREQWVELFLRVLRRTTADNPADILGAKARTRPGFGWPFTTHEFILLFLQI